MKVSWTRDTTSKVLKSSMLEGREHNDRHVNYRYPLLRNFYAEINNLKKKQDQGDQC